LTACAALHAGDTRFWSQGEYAEFQKGNVKKLSLRSDGLVTLAPELHEMFDTSLAYLWALARDSKGVLYLGGGSNAKLYRVPPKGKGELVAELEGLTVQAIAIDAKDRVYAATSPDGKVYRITGKGKPEVFFDPQTKYIWSLAFDAAGNLYVATGDPGEIYRVAPDGKSSVFFHAEETHVRSMTLDAQGNLVVGTEPRGLVLRVSPAGVGFVLYQMPKKEVTAVAVAADGSIYAAATGGKVAPVAPVSALPPAPVAPAAPAATPAAPGATAQAAPHLAVPTPTTMPLLTGAAGGSDVYRIHPDGTPERVWANAADVVYAIGFDAEGRAILGAGNHGSVYRVETPFLHTLLLTTASTQVTALANGPGGRLYAVTGNVGKLYEIGPALEREGTLESDVFDAALFSRWGRLSFEARLNGGQVALSTRGGNLDQPQTNWSPWSAAISEAKGAPIASPAARFLQWRATLIASAESRSPELESVDVAYLSKNLAPRVEQIEITPANYKFPAPVTPAASGAPPPSLTLPPLGKRTAAAFAPSLESPTTSTPALQWAKGWVGARWLAADPNGDSMTYAVEIRGEAETEWKPLKQKLVEKYYSWDSTAFPDGDYRLRVTASDEPSNPPADALTGQLVSEVFTVDNTPPRISGLAAARTGGKLEVRWHAADALSNIAKAEYSLDGGEWTLAAPVTKLSDSLELDYVLSLDAAPGEHTIAIRVEDDCANQAADKVVVR
jgi:sugar lactone lactonase YvrE